MIWQKVSIILNSINLILIAYLLYISTTDSQNNLGKIIANIFLTSSLLFINLYMVIVLKNFKYYQLV